MERWKFILSRTFKGYSEDRCSSFAAGIAYYALLSIFPLAVFAVALAGFVIRDAGAQEQVVNRLMDLLPLNEASGRADLTAAVQTVIKGRSGLGLAGLIGAAWSASALFGALRTALNVVFRVERDRPPVQSKLLDLGMVFGLGGLLLGSFLLTATLAVLRRFGDQIFGASSPLSGTVFNLIALALPALISFLIFTVLYKVVPHAELSWRQTIPGAIVAALGLEALKLGFTQYVTHFGNYGAVYGALGFVIIFLFFAYLTAQITLLGAELVRARSEVLSGAVPVARPALPKPSQSLARRLGTMVKGLFVTEEPHHDDRLPYQPARDDGPRTDREAEHAHPR